MPLNIFEPRYLKMVDDALRGDRLIGMIQPDPDGTASAHPKLFRVGCAGRITQYAETGDGRYLISLTRAQPFPDRRRGRHVRSLPPVSRELR